MILLLFFPGATNSYREKILNALTSFKKVKRAKKGFKSRGNSVFGGVDIF